MPQNILSQKNIIVGVVILMVVLGGGYYFYGMNEDSSGSVSVKVDPTLLKPDLSAYYMVKDKISLKEKDFAFTKKPFYENLKDNTVEFQSVKPTGRPNPFWAP